MHVYYSKPLFIYIKRKILENLLCNNNKHRQPTISDS